MEGAPDANWDVVSSSNIVNASYIFPPTFYVSPQKMNNVLIKGTMSVESTNDNDFAGVVLGYQKPTQLADDNQYKFFLFDWKSKTESFLGYQAQEGFRFSSYNGFITKEDQKKYFWGSVSDSPKRNLLGEKYGSGIGWKHHQKYEFTLLYTSNHIRITIDDEVIFEQNGCFEAGRFGFYCFSQDLTRFEDFTYQTFIDFVPLPKSVCLGEKIHFDAFNLDCSALPDFIQSMHWDFGDGQSSSEINPNHTYFDEGEYEVELIVYKTDNCNDTIVKSVTIKPMPIVDLGMDTLIPACSSIHLDAGNPGDKYVWSTGQVSQTIDLTALKTDTIVWVLVDKNGCQTGDTISIDLEENTIEEQLYFPNAFTPNGDGINDVFVALGIADDVSHYQLFIYDRWGQQIFETDDPNTGWDGGSPIQNGAYIYQVGYFIEGSCIETKTYSESGTVVLLK